MLTVSQTPPTGTNVVSLNDVKSFLRIDYATSDEDTMLSALIDSAVDYCEGYCSRQFDSRAVQYFLSTPHNIKLPIGDLENVTHVKMRLAANLNSRTTTLSVGEQYFLRTGTPGFIRFKNTPTPDGDDMMSTEILATHGTTSVKIPDAVKHAVKMLVAHYYNNREAVVTGTIATTLPIGVQSLLNPHRYVHAS